MKTAATPSDKLSRALLALLVVLCAVYTWRPLQGGEDFWAHAAIGRWIVENRTIPSQTLWLWSTPSQPWIAHSWLSQVFLFGVMQTLGAGGVLGVTIPLVALPFAWAWKLWQKRGGNLVLGALFFAFVIGCASVRFQPRPELFSYFFLAALMLFLIARMDEKNVDNTRLYDAKFFSIALMFTLWANFHGGVALGLAILFLSACGETVQTRFAPGARALWVLFGLCAVAVNFNPYGIHYWQALLPVGGEMFALIDEWKSPLAAPALPPEALLFVALGVLVATQAWLGNPQRRWSQLLWLGFFALFFLSARRNLWPLMMVSALVAAANAGTLSTLRMTGKMALTPLLKTSARVAAFVVVLAWIASAIAPEAISISGGRVLVRAVSARAPEGVARWVKIHNPPEPIFNDYLRSGFFHWHFAGAPPLFIDLLNAYPDQLLFLYFDIVDRKARGPRLFESLKIKTVVFGRWEKTSRIATLAKYLDSSPQWQREYSGADGAVWTRKN